MPIFAFYDDQAMDTTLTDESKERGKAVRWGAGDDAWEVRCAMGEGSCDG